MRLVVRVISGDSVEQIVMASAVVAVEGYVLLVFSVEVMVGVACVPFVVMVVCVILAC